MSKTLIIMRGLPGSGKTTLVDMLVQHLQGSGSYCSTDEFFLDEGRKYTFDYKRIGDAHLWNQGRAEKAMAERKDYIIIDNTNTTYSEIKPYLQMAVRHDYKVKFIQTDNFDVETLFRRNLHGVPKESIQRMKDRWHSESQLLEYVKRDFSPELLEYPIEIDLLLSKARNR